MIQEPTLRQIRLISLMIATGAMPLTTQQIAAFKKELLQQRAVLELAAEQTEADRAPVPLDQQSVGRLSRIDAMQVQAMSQAQQRKRDTDLRNIIGALSRMEDGEFGYCTSCGEEIALKRLAVDPSVRLCITCASSNETS